MNKIANYKICRLSNENGQDAFLKFWNENHQKRLDEKYARWYQANPAGKATVLVAKDSDDSLIGCFAVFPRKVSINGTSLRVGLAGDFLVHEKHRVLVPAIKLAKALVSLVREGEFDLIYGFPNRSAEPVMKRAGFKCLGPRTRLVRILGVSAYLKRFRLYKYVGRLLSPLLDVAVRLLSFETWYRFKAGFICEEIDTFDRRLDGLWMKSNSRFQAIGERTSELLGWRFPKQPGAERRIFVISSTDRTELKGYIVYCIDEQSISIEDFVLPEDKKATRVFIAHFLRYVRNESVRSVVVQFLENKGLLEVFKRFGFVERKSDWNIYYYGSERTSGKFPDIADQENWFLSGFDTESFRV